MQIDQQSSHINSNSQCLSLKFHHLLFYNNLLLSHLGEDPQFLKLIELFTKHELDLQQIFQKYSTSDHYQSKLTYINSLFHINFMKMNYDHCYQYSLILRELKNAIERKYSGNQTEKRSNQIDFNVKNEEFEKREEKQEYNLLKGEMMCRSGQSERDEGIKFIRRAVELNQKCHFGYADLAIESLLKKQRQNGKMYIGKAIAIEQNWYYRFIERDCYKETKQFLVLLQAFNFLFHEFIGMQNIYLKIVQILIYHLQIQGLHKASLIFAQISLQISLNIPFNSSTAIRLIQESLNKGQYQKANQLILKRLEQNDNDEDLDYLYGIYHFKLQDHYLAIKYFHKSTYKLKQIIKDLQLQLINDEINKPQKSIYKLIQDKYKQKLMGRFALISIICDRASIMDNGIQFAKEAVQYNHQCIERYLLRGMILLQQGGFEQAFNQFMSFVKIGTPMIEYQCYILESLCEMEKYHECVRYAQQLKKIFEEFSTECSVSLSYYKICQQTKGQNRMMKFLQMQSDPIYYYKFGDLLFQLKYIDKSLIFFNLFCKKTQNPSYELKMTNKVFDTISAKLLNELREKMNRQSIKQTDKIGKNKQQSCLDGSEIQSHSQSRFQCYQNKLKFCLDLSVIYNNSQSSFQCDQNKQKSFVDQPKNESSKQLSVQCDILNKLIGTKTEIQQSQQLIIKRQTRRQQMQQILKLGNISNRLQAQSNNYRQRVNYYRQLLEEQNYNIHYLFLIYLYQKITKSIGLYETYWKIFSILSINHHNYYLQIPQHKMIAEQYIAFVQNIPPRQKQKFKYQLQTFEFIVLQELILSQDDEKPYQQPWANYLKTINSYTTVFTTVSNTIAKFKKNQLMVSLFARRLLRQNQIIGFPLIDKLKQQHFINRQQKRQIFQVMVMQKLQSLQFLCRFANSFKQINQRVNLQKEINSSKWKKEQYLNNIAYMRKLQNNLKEKVNKSNQLNQEQRYEFVGNIPSLIQNSNIAAVQQNILKVMIIQKNINIQCPRKFFSQQLNLRRQIHQCLSQYLRHQNKERLYKELLGYVDLLLKRFMIEQELIKHIYIQFWVLLRKLKVQNMKIVALLQLLKKVNVSEVFITVVKHVIDFGIKINAQKFKQTIKEIQKRERLTIVVHQNQKQIIEIDYIVSNEIIRELKQKISNNLELSSIRLEQYNISYIIGLLGYKSLDNMAKLIWSAADSTNQLLKKETKMYCRQIWFDCFIRVQEGYQFYSFRIAETFSRVYVDESDANQNRIETIDKYNKKLYDHITKLIAQQVRVTIERILPILFQEQFHAIIVQTFKNQLQAEVSFQLFQSILQLRATLYFNRQYYRMIRVIFQLMDFPILKQKRIQQFMIRLKNGKIKPIFFAKSINSIIKKGITK